MTRENPKDNVWFPEIALHCDITINYCLERGNKTNLLWFYYFRERSCDNKICQIAVIVYFKKLIGLKACLL